MSRIPSMLTLAALLAAPALAAPDPAALAAARALVAQIDVKGQVTKGMLAIVADMRSGGNITRLLSTQQGFAMARSKQPQKFDDVLKKVGGLQAGAAEKIVLANVGAVADAAVDSYATHYTAAEIKALAEFYKSPLGVTMARKQPLIVADINRATGQIMGAKMQAAMESVKPQIAAELKRLQPPPAAKPAS